MMKSFKEYLEETIRTYGPVGAGPGTGYAHTAALESREKCDEGEMKRLMHSDAEQMSLDQFCEKYGDDEWVVEFYRDINDPVDSEQTVDEGHMKDIDIERQDYEKMSPLAFRNRYHKSKEEWYDQHRSLLKPKKQQDKAHWDFGRILELAGVADHKFDREDDAYCEDQDAQVVAQKELDTAITNPMPGVHENRKNK